MPGTNDNFDGSPNSDALDFNSLNLLRRSSDSLALLRVWISTNFHEREWTRSRLAYNSHGLFLTLVHNMVKISSESMEVQTPALSRLASYSRVLSLTLVCSLVDSPSRLAIAGFRTEQVTCAPQTTVRGFVSALLQGQLQHANYKRQNICAHDIYEAPLCGRLWFLVMIFLKVVSVGWYV